MYWGFYIDVRLLKKSGNIKYDCIVYNAKSYIHVICIKFTLRLFKNSNGLMKISIIYCLKKYINWNLYKFSAFNLLLEQWFSFRYSFIRSTSGVLMRSKGYCVLGYNSMYAKNWRTFILDFRNINCWMLRRTGENV